MLLCNSGWEKTSVQMLGSKTLWLVEGYDQILALGQPWGKLGFVEVSIGTDGDRA